MIIKFIIMPIHTVDSYDDSNGEENDHERSQIILLRTHRKQHDCSEAPFESMVVYSHDDVDIGSTSTSTGTEEDAASEETILESFKVYSGIHCGD